MGLEVDVDHDTGENGEGEKETGILPVELRRAIGIIDKGRLHRQREDNMGPMGSRGGRRAEEMLMGDLGETCAGGKG